MKKITYLLIFLLTIILSISPVFADEVEIEADFAYLINMETHEVLVDKNGTEQIYPASMTKIMTVLVALENNDDLSKTFTIKNSIINRMISENASMAGFWAGDEVSILDLCYGALLPSGAECTESLALVTSGSVEAFVELMNEKAKELKMENTHFENTTGLHDSNHYSTCVDLSLLLEYAWKNETFREIFCTDLYTTSPTASHPEGLELKSTSLLLLKNTNVLGAKSGFTNPAGRCLASVASCGETYILIVAHAPNSETISPAITDTINIYDYIYTNYNLTTFVKEGEYLRTIPVNYSLEEETIDIYATDEIRFTALKTAKTVVTLSDLEAPLHTGDLIGSIDIVNGKEVLAHQDILMDHDIETTDFIIKYYDQLIYFKYHKKEVYQTGAAILFVLLLLIRIIIHKNKRK